MRKTILTLGAAAAVILLAVTYLSAGPLRERSAARGGGLTDLFDTDDVSRDVTLPPGVRVIRDIPYGRDAAQRFDVYLPAHPVNAPVIFMVHGGGWRRGDKGARSVVENKVARWVPKGYVFISTNYRMLPDADPVQQAKDVALALASAQRRAGEWGADPKKFVLMGHSAGAHLVALLSTSPAITSGLSITPWRGVVCLDSAALDVPRIMNARHFRLYDEAFGSDPGFWRRASPYEWVSKGDAPMLCVCSSRRQDSCDQASRFVSKMGIAGNEANVLSEDLSHREINETLGAESAYTRAVADFIANVVR